MWSRTHARVRGGWAVVRSGPGQLSPVCSTVSAVSWQWLTSPHCDQGLSRPPVIAAVTSQQGSLLPRPPISAPLSCPSVCSCVCECVCVFMCWWYVACVHWTPLPCSQGAEQKAWPGRHWSPATSLSHSLHCPCPLLHHTPAQPCPGAAPCPMVPVCM